METKSYKTINKTTWGPGEWQEEPDKVQWPDPRNGLPCLAVRNYHSGIWCGYVGVPPGHALYGKDYSDVNVDVHGGLTFSDRCHTGLTEATGICHVPGPGEPDHVWWFGFDCGHLGDVSPGSKAFHLPSASWGEVYRTLTYVRNQCALLAEQLAAC